MSARRQCFLTGYLCSDCGRTALSENPIFVFMKKHCTSTTFYWNQKDGWLLFQTVSICFVDATRYPGCTQDEPEFSEQPKSMGYVDFL